MPYVFSLDSHNFFSVELDCIYSFDLDVRHLRLSYHYIVTRCSTFLLSVNKYSISAFRTAITPICIDGPGLFPHDIRGASFQSTARWRLHPD